MEPSCYVYILANRKDGTLYVGVPSALVQRVYQHKTGAVKGFTKKYGVDRLVHFEPFEDIQLAIAREKQIKKWNCRWKLELIEKDNPDWADLYSEIAS